MEKETLYKFFDGKASREERKNLSVSGWNLLPKTSKSFSRNVSFRCDDPVGQYEGGRDGKRNPGLSIELSCSKP